MMFCPYCKAEIETDTLEILGAEEADFATKDSTRKTHISINIGKKHFGNTHIMHCMLESASYCAKCGRVIAVYRE